MKIKTEAVKGRDLKPGDLFSTAGPEYWDVMTRGAVGEKVYIRTDAAAREHDLDTPVYRLTIEQENR